MLFCVQKPETIEHLFWFCDRILPPWGTLPSWIFEQTNIEVDLSFDSVLLGYTRCTPFKNAINYIILGGDYMANFSPG